jgi:hypothetical protein
MTSHPTIQDALRAAIKAAGQPESLYHRLEAWLNALRSGRVEIARDREDTLSRLQEVLNTIHLTEDEQ